MVYAQDPVYVESIKDGKVLGREVRKVVLLIGTERYPVEIWRRVSIDLATGEGTTPPSNPPPNTIPPAVVPCVTLAAAGAALRVNDCEGSFVEVTPAEYNIFNWDSTRCGLVFWSRDGRIQWGGSCETVPARPSGLRYQLPPAWSRYLGTAILSAEPSGIRVEKVYPALRPTDVWDTSYSLITRP